jgi:hypothetical protein
MNIKSLVGLSILLLNTTPKIIASMSTLATLLLCVVMRRWWVYGFFLNPMSQNGLWFLRPLWGFRYCKNRDRDDRVLKPFEMRLNDNDRSGGILTASYEDLKTQMLTLEFVGDIRSTEIPVVRLERFGRSAPSLLDFFRLYTELSMASPTPQMAYKNLKFGTKISENNFTSISHWSFSGISPTTGDTFYLG